MAAAAQIGHRMKAKTKTLDALGERGLLHLLTAHWRQGRGVRVGVGDDCAVLESPVRGGESLLFKTDAVVEAVHFTASTPPAQIGHKALARALSDIAAMGGEPWAALVTLGIPPQTDPARLRGIYRGMEKLAAKCGVALVGGETTRAESLFISISLLGKTKGCEPVLRSTGRVGDLLFVTGTLGRSFPNGKHLRFEPRLREGQWLARRGYARAMMDISDGLGADAPRLAAASKLGFRLELPALPRSPMATVEEALHDGEDYELLVAVSPSDAKKLLRQWPFTLALTCIGALTKTCKDSHERGGFDHFKKTPR